MSDVPAKSPNPENSVVVSSESRRIVGAWPVTMRGLVASLIPDADPASDVVQLSIRGSVFGLEFEHKQWYAKSQLERAKRDGAEFMSRAGFKDGKWVDVEDGQLDYQ